MKFLLILVMCLSVSVSHAKKIVLTEANSISINQPITSEFVAVKSVEVLKKAAALAKGEELYLVLYTPGGSVIAGNSFIDLIASLPVKVNTITLFAASMGYHIAQSLGTRYITPSGILMSHRGAISGIGGQINGELNSRVAFFTEMTNIMDAIVAKRLNQSLAAYQASIVNELWLNSPKALESHNADELAEVSCSKELASKTEVQSMQTLFGSMEVEFSKCPLITAPIGLKSGSDKAFSRVKAYFSNIVPFIYQRL